MSSQMDVPDHLRPGKGPWKALNGKLDLPHNQFWAHKKSYLTLLETEACFLGLAIRNIAAVAMYNELKMRWKEGYLKHYPETLPDRLRNTTKKPGPISGWPSWKS